MRKGFMGCMVMRTDTGELLGIAAGGDATSEHFQGLAPMQSRFGCPTHSRLSINERILRRIPPEYGLEELEDGSLLMSSDIQKAKHFLKSELFFSKDEQLAGAWDNTNFAFRAREGAIDALREIADALTQGRVMFGGLLQLYFLESGGLILALKDRIPGDYLEAEQVRVAASVRLAQLHQAA